MTAEPTGDREERPTDAEYIAQLESYNRTLQARIAAAEAERDAAARRAEDLEAMTRASVDEANLALAAVRVRADGLADLLRFLVMQVNDVKRTSVIRESDIYMRARAALRLAADPEGGSPDA